jgi:catechol 2,3-dioxygenase-like lactoylglutathione lyase family enzyme
LSPAAIAKTSSNALDQSPNVKRTSMWVPDLDRAVLFFHTVIGFSIESRKELKLDENSVLFDLFNVDPKQKIRRVLFSSPLQERVLFVMESADAPRYSREDKRSSILVIRTDDMNGVIERAKTHGFAIGRSNISTAATTGRTFTETTVFGPAGNAVLLYEISR